MAPVLRRPAGVVDAVDKGDKKGKHKGKGHGKGKGENKGSGKSNITGKSEGVVAQRMPSLPFQLTIVNGDEWGEPIALDVEGSDTIAIVKTKMVEQWGQGSWVLEFDNKLLRDDCTLSDYNIKAFDDVICHAVPSDP
jgi:hypothetical protein